MLITTIVGARPQFIKAAVVSRALRERPHVTERLIHTGQHYDTNMSDVFFKELAIPSPDHYLGIGSGTHGQQTGRMLEALERVLCNERPDWVLIYGDTNTTLAGALAAGKLHLPVAHVEAGLRSFNREMPEELNRVVADHVASLLFAPTAASVENLRREGIAGSRVHLVGDVMYDVALRFAECADAGDRLQAIGVTPGTYVLATIHRQENTDHPDRLRTIFDGLTSVARDIPVVIPLHPRTRQAMRHERLDYDTRRGLHVVPPVGYLDMLLLERHAAAIVTDSGGVQKEAYFFRVPCVTLRTETEWNELLSAGTNRLCPPLSAEAVERVIRACINEGFPSHVCADLYGRGNAATLIVDALVVADRELLHGRNRPCSP